jgi:hypothetical protein
VPRTKTSTPLHKPNGEVPVKTGAFIFIEIDLRTGRGNDALTFRKLSGHRLRFLGNWNVPLIEDEIKRRVNRF